MAEEQWEVVEEVAGTIQAEILGGLLQAQGIAVMLSQEGAGHWVYASNIGTLGRVQILVPTSGLERARQVLADYYAGLFADTPPLTDETLADDSEAEDQDLPPD